MRRLRLILLLTLINCQTIFSQDVIVQNVLDKSEIGIAQFNKGDYENALTTFNELINELEKGSAQDLIPEVYLYRAKINIQLKLTENVCTDLASAIKFNISDAFLVAKENCPSAITPIVESNWNYDTGSTFFWDKDYLKAIPYFNKAIELNPNNQLAIEARALSYSITGQLDNALLDYMTIVNMSPDNKSYYTHCGEILFELNRIEEAVSYSNKALDHDPNDPFALTTRGKCNRVLKNYNEAISDLTKVIKKFPGDEVYLERAKAYVGLGDNKKACKDLRNVSTDSITDEVKELIKMCNEK